jgi:hypothetical protein
LDVRVVVGFGSFIAAADAGSSSEVLDSEKMPILDVHCVWAVIKLKLDSCSLYLREGASYMVYDTYLSMDGAAMTSITRLCRESIVIYCTALPFAIVEWGLQL